jgi:hypothetical protein
MQDTEDASRAYVIPASVTGDITLTAEWTARTDITLILDANDGTEATVVLTGLTYDSAIATGEITLPTEGSKDAPTREGYKLIGWSTEKGEFIEGRGTTNAVDILASTSVTNSENAEWTEGMRAYAVWGTTSLEATGFTYGANEVKFSEETALALANLKALDAEGKEIALSDITVNKTGLDAIIKAQENHTRGTYDLTFTTPDGTKIIVSVAVKDKAAGGSETGTGRVSANNAAYEITGKTLDTESVRTLFAVEATDSKGHAIPEEDIKVDAAGLATLVAAQEKHQTGTFPLTFSLDDGTKVTVEVSLIDSRSNGEKPGGTGNLGSTDNSKTPTTPPVAGTEQPGTSTGNTAAGTTADSSAQTTGETSAGSANTAGETTAASENTAATEQSASSTAASDESVSSTGTSALTATRTQADTTQKTDPITFKTSPYLREGFTEGEAALLEAQTGNPLADLFQGSLPLGNLTTTAVAGFLNLILALLALVGLIVLTARSIRYRVSRQGRAVLVSAVAALTLAVATTTLWLALDSLARPTAWVNGYTSVVATLFLLFITALAVHIVVSKGARSKARKRTEKRLAPQSAGL